MNGDMVSHRLFAAWLGSVTLLIIAMIVFGGLVRLTDAGLSIVEWKVILGAIPPVTPGQWNAAFEQYKLFPQFHHDPSMSMGTFKFIYLMEYGHRLLGRIIGLAIAFPMLWWSIRQRLSREKFLFGWMLFVLVFLQGALGWYMVKSGLVDIPRVSHFRLAAHLLLALVILGFAVWHLIMLFPSARAALESARTDPIFENLALIASLLIFLQIMLGAFVAGLRAGGVSDTFPKMLGEWIPSIVWSYKPILRNFVENPYAIHFFHRVLGFGVSTACLFVALRTLRQAMPRLVSFAAWIQLGLVGVQITLGIFTVVLHVPVWLASLHQFVAILIWMTSCALSFSWHARANAWFRAATRGQNRLAAASPDYAAR